MASDQQFCLRWNNHQSTLISVFDTLLENEKLVDCTLAADGQYLKAHKVVLSACSPYLEAMLSQHFDQHPILILKDVKYQELKAMLDYMYRGEVNISEEQLGHFLKAAESLQIKGLSDRGGSGSGGGGSENGNDQVKRHEARKSTTHVPHLPNPRTVVPHSAYGLEQKKPHMNPQDLVRPKSPLSRDECGSPLPRKRRRPNRPSSTDSNMFSAATHYSESFSEGNSSDTPSSNVPTVNTTPSTVTTPKAPPETERNEPDSYLGESALTKPVIKTEIPHPLVQPKTEYVDYENEDSVEDATLDADEDDEANLSRPGPSFTSGSPGMTPWQLSADGSSDEMFLAAQEGAGANQNSQELFMRDLKLLKRFKSMPDLNADNRNLEMITEFEDLSDANETGNEIRSKYFETENIPFEVVNVEPDIDLSVKDEDSTLQHEYSCTNCSRTYGSKNGLNQHLRFECGQKPKFACPKCQKLFHRKGTMKRHSMHCRSNGMGEDYKGLNE